MTVFQEVGIDLKITQPNLMVLVSFSSAEDVLSNDVKNMIFFFFLARKVLKIRRPLFWGHPVYRGIIFNRNSIK